MPKTALAGGRDELKIAGHAVEAKATFDNGLSFRMGPAPCATTQALLEHTFKGELHPNPIPPLPLSRPIPAVRSNATLWLASMQAIASASRSAGTTTPASRQTRKRATYRRAATPRLTYPPAGRPTGA